MKERSKGRVLGALAVLAAALSCDGEQAPREEVARATMALGGLRVQYHHGEDPSATNGDIKPFFRIMNDGSTAIPLSELTLRYFYTREGISAESSDCWWTQTIGCGNINRSNPALTPARSGADHVFELGFKSSAGNLAANANTGDIKVGFHKNDWTAYNENGDFSYVAAQTQWADAPKLALYRNGSLVWGSEPGGGGGTGGASGQGGTAQGGTAQGGTAQGGTAQGGTAQGGTAQGGTAQGGTAQGGTTGGAVATGGTGGSGGTNVALNKPTSASTEQSGTPSSYANDSDTSSSRWCATTADTGRWWQVDLGGLHAITGTELRWPDARIYRYAISVSTDGSTWQEVIDKRTNTSSAQIQNDAFLITARHVRIMVTGLPDASTAACLVDFEVFGTPSGGGVGGAPSTGGVPAAGGSTPAGGNGGTAGGTAGLAGSTSTGGAPIGGISGTGASGGSTMGGTAGTAGAPGDTTVEFFFKLPTGVPRGNVTFATTGGDLRIADGVDVTEGGSGLSSVSSVDGGAVARLGVGVDVQNVWSDGAVLLANSAHVHGFVESESSVQRQPGSIVDGLVRPYRSIAPLQTIRWNVVFPATTQGSVNLEPGQTRSLGPGAYGTATVKSGAHLQLGTGTYTFGSMAVETGGYLDVNNTGGAVSIYLRDGFTFRGTVTRTATQPNILFGVGGANAIAIENTFFGILVAPWAQVTLGTHAGQYQGSFFAHSIEALAITVVHEALQPAHFCAAGSPCTSFCPCGPNTPGCTSSDQCDGAPCSPNGICACQPNCATKQCGDDPDDGCGSQCAGLCGNGEEGCTSDLECPSGSYCKFGAGPQKQFPEGTNLCLPVVCRLQDPRLPNCGVGLADCGTCPVCVPDCADKMCGPDDCGGSCGETPEHALCIGGMLVASAQAHEYSPSFPAPLPPMEPSGPEAGALPGAFSVSDRGTANYTIPIQVPPGRGGVQPNLSLTYTSTSANGLLGVGWTLTGLSKIERCPRTVAHDGVARPVMLTADDALCLDGERIYHVPGASVPDSAPVWPTRTHYTKVERFNAIAAFGPVYQGSTYTGPQGFRIWTKDGRILTYGQGNGAVSTQGVHRVWALSEVQDRVGNSVQFRYQTLVENEKYPHEVLSVQEMVPETILYGGQHDPLDPSPNPTWKYPHTQEILFNYQLRADVRHQYVAGHLVTSSQLLSSIETRAMDRTVSVYWLKYSDEGDRPSRLLNVRRCSDATFERCLPATTFDYNALPANLGSSETAPLVSAGSHKIHAVLDWNGDGADDLLLRNDTGWVILRTELQENGTRAWVAAPIAGLPAPDEIEGRAPTGRMELVEENGKMVEKPEMGPPQPVQVMDLDRDGRDDVVSSRTSTVYHSTPTGFGVLWENSSLNSLQRILLADLNGDGLRDLITCSGSDSELKFFQNTSLAFHAGSPFGLLGDKGCEKLFVIDRDGDGSDDLMYTNHFIGGDLPTVLDWVRDVWEDAGFSEPFNGDSTLDYQTVQLDWNGDGLKDLYVWGSVWISTGKGFVRQSAPVYGNGRDGLFATDYDNDGLEDLLVESYGDIYKATPDGQGRYLDAAFAGNLDSRVWIEGEFCHTRLADIDGDGDNEWAYVKQDGSLHITDPASLRANLVSVITDGIGKRIGISYSPTVPKTDGSNGYVPVYTPGTAGPQTATGPVLLRRVAPLVSRHGEVQVVPNDPIGKNGPRYLYTYQGAKLGWGGQGWFGFSSRQITALDMGKSDADTFVPFTTTTRTFLNDEEWQVGLVGNVVERSNTVAAGDISGPYIRSTITTNYWDQYTPPSAQGQCIWMGSQSTDVYENDQRLGPILKYITFFTPDEHCNVSGRWVRVLKGGTVESSSLAVGTTYQSDETSWLIANPIDQQVTSNRNSFSVTRAVHHEYYSDGLLWTVTREPGDPVFRQTTTYERNEARNVSHVVVSDSPPGAPPPLPGPNSRHSWIDYDSQQLFPVEYRNGLEHRTEVEYDLGTGQVLTMADPNGRVTQRQYDPFGRLRNEVLPTHSVETTYSAAPVEYLGGLGRIFGFGTKQQVFYRDQSQGGSSLTVVDPFGRVVKTAGTGLLDQQVQAWFIRDWAGRVVISTVPRGESGPDQGFFGYAYDALGRLSTVTWPDGIQTQYDYASILNANPMVAGLFHDEAIWVTSLRDRRDHYELSVLDHNRAPLDVAQASSLYPNISDLRLAGAVTSYQYGAFDQVALVTDPDGDQTSIGYDRIGRKAMVSNANTGTHVYGYDGVDDLAWHIDPGLGGRTCFSYDALGRQTEIRRVFGDCSIAGKAIASFTYDGTEQWQIGQIASAFRAATPDLDDDGSNGTTIDYGYEQPQDGRPITARLENVCQTFADAGPYVCASIKYEDYRPFVKNLVYPSPDPASRPEIEYQYDNAGNLTGVLDANGWLNNKAYWTMTGVEQGMRITGESFGDELQTSYTYYGLAESQACASTADTGCLPGALHTTTTSPLDQPSNVLQGTSYTYSAMGQVTSRISLTAEASGEKFEYDDLNRLSKLNRLSGSTDLGHAEYAYSPAGDLMSVKEYAPGSGEPLSNQTYGYDPVHRIYSFNGNTYLHDDAGRQTVRNLQDASGSPYTQSLVYDDFGMPSKTVTGPDTTLLEYDAGGNRVAKRTSTGQTTLYFGDLYECEDPTPAEPTQPATCAKNRFKIHAAGKLVAQITQDVAASETEIRFMHSDHLGSGTLITDGTGALREKRHFDAFGKPNGETDPADSSVRAGFTGHEHDPELGLINMKGRLYDPHLRRFITPDPFITEPFNPQGMNRYSYVQNSPLTYTDPSGFMYEYGGPGPGYSGGGSPSISAAPGPGYNPGPSPSYSPGTGNGGVPASGSGYSGGASSGRSPNGYWVYSGYSIGDMDAGTYEAFIIGTWVNSPSAASMGMNPDAPMCGPSSGEVSTPSATGNPSTAPRSSGGAGGSNYQSGWNGTAGSGTGHWLAYADYPGNSLFQTAGGDRALAAGQWGFGIVGGGAAIGLAVYGVGLGLAAVGDAAWAAAGNGALLARVGTVAGVGLGAGGGMLARGGAQTVLYHGSDRVSVAGMVQAQGISREAARALGGGDVFWATADLSAARIFALANPAGGDPAVMGMRLSTGAFDALRTSGSIAIDRTGAVMVTNWASFNVAVSEFFVHQ